MGSSDQHCICACCPIAPMQPQNPQRKWCFWHYATADGKGWRGIFLITRRIIIASKSGIPPCAPSAEQKLLSLECKHTAHTLSLFLMQKIPCAITLVFVPAMLERRLTSLFDNHAPYISLWHCTKSILILPKIFSFINNVLLANSSSSKYFWNHAKSTMSTKNFPISSFPPHLNYDAATAVTSVCKALWRIQAIFTFPLA